jgi:hypothetical protein
MASCPACGAPQSNGPTCLACGAAVAPAARGAAPAFELDLPKRAAPTRSAKVATSAAFDATIDLAFDPRSAFAAPPGPPSAIVTAGAAAIVVSPRAGAIEPAVDDVDADARLLADHGEPPRHWLLTAPYAWRVLRRRRELRHALSVRRDEVRRARDEVEDALVAFAESARATAEDHPDYADALAQLRRAEEVLRSRDRVLAAENDAHSARLASVDARIGKLTTEREQVRSEERGAAAQLATAQAELARAEASLKRAESELRSAQQRESVRGRE